MSSGILTLTTDFGADGPYVAAMKGVVLGLAPDARLVDVSHAIGPQDVREAGFVLSQVLPYFPPGTVHLAVVDPGVGTDRRLVIVQALDQWFVAPDNGLIGVVLQGRAPVGAWEIRATAQTTASATFHGRDILAPTAAMLLRGQDATTLGPHLADLVILPPIAPVESAILVTGEVVFIDSFGNLITNLTREHIAEDSTGGWTVEIAGVSLGRPIRTYGDRPHGDVVALIGSSGRMEVAEVNGSAARRLGLGRGSTVRLIRDGGSGR